MRTAHKRACRFESNGYVMAAQVKRMVAKVGGHVEQLHRECIG